VWLTALLQVVKSGVSGMVIPPEHPEKKTAKDKAKITLFTGTPTVISIYILIIRYNSPE
jgi:hypothetical protein